MYSPTSAWWKQMMAIGSACLHSDVAFAATPNPYIFQHKVPFSWIWRIWVLPSRNKKSYQRNISHIVHDDSLILGRTFRNPTESWFHDVIAVKKLLFSCWFEPNFVLNHPKKKKFFSWLNIWLKMNFIHLCIRCQVIQSCDMKSKLSCFGEFPKASSYAAEIVPINRNSMLEE